MSRVKYDFVNTNDRPKSFAEEYDTRIFQALRDAATVNQIGSENFIDSLNKAIAVLNTPEYLLISNPVHKDELDKLINEKELRVKVLYYDRLEENKFMLVKQGAARLDVYYPEGMSSFFEIKYEPRILQPEEIRIFEAR